MTTILRYQCNIELYIGGVVLERSLCSIIVGSLEFQESAFRSVDIAPLANFWHDLLVNFEITLGLDLDLVFIYFDFIASTPGGGQAFVGI